MGGNGGQSLRAWDIWLGDYSHHARPVNGKSFMELKSLREEVSRDGINNKRGPSTTKVTKVVLTNRKLAACVDSQ